MVSPENRHNFRNALIVVSAAIALFLVSRYGFRPAINDYLATATITPMAIASASATATRTETMNQTATPTPRVSLLFSTFHEATFWCCPPTTDRNAVIQRVLAGQDVFGNSVELAEFNVVNRQFGSGALSALLEQQGRRVLVNFLPNTTVGSFISTRIEIGKLPVVVPDYEHKLSEQDLVRAKRLGLLKDYAVRIFDNGGYYLGDQIYSFSQQ